ncbi:MAG: twin-arginine translocation signal domain-containing protein [Anaerolinea sp.]|nr:twin-arginine translocation signal domain-containing protein [Anaerolinea sp.]
MTTQPDLLQPTDSDEEPQVFAVSHNGEGTALTRRDFLVAAGTVTAAGALLGTAGGTVTPASAAQDITPTPMPTSSPQEIGETCQPINAHNDAVLAIALSADGSLLVSGSWDETIKLWSLPDGALLRTPTGHTGGVSALALSPDGFREW